MKPCLDCKQPANGSRCPTCKQTKDRARGTSTDRGYGIEHQTERARHEPAVSAGLVDCARCCKRIAPGDDWDLGHDDLDRSKYTGPEHVTCNRAAASRMSGGVPTGAGPWHGWVVQL